MKKIVFTLIVASLMALPGTAQARPGQWQRNHPWRAQDNQRLRNQNQRINQGLRSGALTPTEARTLRQQDHQIRLEERAMASGNKGGHLTPAQQQTLNQQLNQNSRTIYQEKHD